MSNNNRSHEHVTLRSTAITSLDYDGQAKELKVTFTSGQSATYPCDRETFTAFASAPSAGRFFHQIFGR